MDGFEAYYELAAQLDKWMKEMKYMLRTIEDREQNVEHKSTYVASYPATSEHGGDE